MILFISFVFPFVYKVLKSSLFSGVLRGRKGGYVPVSASSSRRTHLEAIVVAAAPVRIPKGKTLGD